MLIAREINKPMPNVEMFRMRLLIDRAGGGALFVVVLHNDILVILVGDLPNGLAGQRLELCVDLIGIVPSAYCTVIHEFGSPFPVFS